MNRKGFYQQDFYGEIPPFIRFRTVGLVFLDSPRKGKRQSIQTFLRRIDENAFIGTSLTLTIVIGGNSIFADMNSFSHYFRTNLRSNFRQARSYEFLMFFRSIQNDCCGFISSILNELRTASNIRLSFYDTFKSNSLPYDVISNWTDTHPKDNDVREKCLSIHMPSIQNTSTLIEQMKKVVKLLFIF